MMFKTENIIFLNFKTNSIKTNYWYLTWIINKLSATASRAKQIVTIIQMRPTKILLPPAANNLIISMKPLEKYTCCSEKQWSPFFCKFLSISKHTITKHPPHAGNYSDCEKNTRSNEHNIDDKEQHEINRTVSSKYSLNRCYSYEWNLILLFFVFLCLQLSKLG